MPVRFLLVHFVILPMPVPAAVEPDTFGCVANTIKLRSGIYFDLANPDPATISLPDVAGALSKICRFGGHCSRFFSVAEHSVNCARQAAEDGLPPDAQLAVLLHDATEAFVGDMVKPLKTMLPEYVVAERRVARAIEQAFGIDIEKWKAEIKEIDRAMVIAERRIVFGSGLDSVVWPGEHEVRQLSPPIEYHHPDDAEDIFIRQYAKIKLLRT